MNRHSRSRRGALIAAVGAALCLLFVLPGAAQDKPKPKSSGPAYALIFGTVFEADGHLAYGVPIKLRRADQKKTLQDALSDHSGEFAFRVPPGPADYVVWADVKPSKKHDKSKADKHLPAPAPGQLSSQEVRVHVDNEERVDISLHLTE